MPEKLVPPVLRYLLINSHIYAVIFIPLFLTVAVTLLQGKMECRIGYFTSKLITDVFFNQLLSLIKVGTHLPFPSTSSRTHFITRAKKIPCLLCYNSGFMVASYTIKLRAVAMVSFSGDSSGLLIAFWLQNSTLKKPGRSTRI